MHYRKLIIVASFAAAACISVPEGHITRRTGTTSAIEGGNKYVEFIDRRPAKERPARYEGDIIFVDMKADGSIDGYLIPLIQKPMPLEDISRAPETVKTIAGSIVTDYFGQEPKGKWWR